MFCGAVFEVKYGIRLALVSSLLKESEKMNGLLRMMSCPRCPPSVPSFSSSSSSSSPSSSLVILEEQDHQLRVELMNDINVLSCLKNVCIIFFFPFLCTFLKSMNPTTGRS